MRCDDEQFVTTGNTCTSQLICSSVEFELHIATVASDVAITTVIVVTTYIN